MSHEQNPHRQCGHVCAVSNLAGMMMQDPNTGVAMFETPQIIEYLEKTYAV